MLPLKRQHFLSVGAALADIHLLHRQVVARREVQGRKGGVGGICIAASEQCVVIGSFSEQAGQTAAPCYDAVQKVAEYLSRHET